MGHVVLEAYLPHPTLIRKKLPSHLTPRADSDAIDFIISLYYIIENFMKLFGHPNAIK
jgi:hypothetical protein